MSIQPFSGTEEDESRKISPLSVKRASLADLVAADQIERPISKGEYTDMLLKLFPRQELVDVDDLRSHKLAVPTLLSYFLFFGTILIGICAVNTINLHKENFHAPEARGNSLCEDQPLAVSGTYNLDAFGEWSTSKSFRGNSSIYELELNAVQLTTSEFFSEFKMAQIDHKRMGKKVAQRDLSYAVAVLAAYRYNSEKYTLQFYPNTDVRQILSATPYSCGIVSSYGVCDQVSVCAVRDGRFYLTISDLYSCPNQLLASDLVSQLRNVVSMEVKMDIASIYMAVAINLNIIDMKNSGLETVALPRLKKAKNTNFYIDSFYDDMDPIFCVRLSKRDQACFYYYLRKLFYPIITTYGVFNTECTGSNSYDFVDVVTGLIFFRDDTSSVKLLTFVNELHAQIAQEGGNDITLRGKIHNALMEAIDSTYTGYIPSAPTNGNQTKPSAIEELCGDCSIAVFETYAEDPIINRYGVRYTQLIQGNLLHPSSSSSSAALPSSSSTASNIDDTEYVDIVGIASSFLQEHHDHIDGEGLKEPRELYHGVLPETLQIKPKLTRMKFQSIEITADDDDDSTDDDITIVDDDVTDDVDTTGNDDSTYTGGFDCKNIIYFEHIFNSVDESPVTLIQNYKVCHLTLGSSFQRALGIAAGSAALYSTIGFVLLLMMIIVSVNGTLRTHHLNRLKPKQVKETIKQNVRDAALYELISISLRNMNTSQIDYQKLETLLTLLPELAETDKMRKDISEILETHGIYHGKKIDEHIGGRDRISDTLQSIFENTQYVKQV